jgi:hypothetical protein
MVRFPHQSLAISLRDRLRDGLTPDERGKGSEQQRSD